MATKKTLREQIEPIFDDIEWGAISEALFGRAYAIDERLQADNFTREEREQLCEALQAIAGRITLVADDIKANI